MSIRIYYKTLEPSYDKNLLYNPIHIKPTNDKTNNNLYSTTKCKALRQPYNKMKIMSNTYATSILRFSSPPESESSLDDKMALDLILLLCLAVRPSSSMISFLLLSCCLRRLRPLPSSLSASRLDLTKQTPHYFVGSPHGPLLDAVR